MKNRVLLNIVCIFVIVVSLIGIYFTVQDARTINSVENTPYSEPIGEMTPGDGGIRPEMPQGGNYQPQPNNSDVQMPNEGFDKNRDNFQNQINEQKQVITFTVFQTVVIVVCSMLISLIAMLMIYTKFFKNSFKDTFINKDKVIILVLSTLLLGSTFSFVINTLTKNSSVIVESEDGNETTGDDISSGEKVSAKDIDLNAYDTNVTITEAGTYTLSGELNHTVLIDAEGKVTLNLNGVTINSEETAAIANRSENDLVINIMEGTTNDLTDGGNSEYDGSLYSNGHLYIEGSGTLNIYGNQSEGEGIATTDNDITINGGTIYIESNDDGINAGGDVGGTITINDGIIQIKASGDGIDSNDNIVINGGTVYAMGSSTGGDAGIDADNGYEINGGLVIGLGSDMLELPSDSSKQNTICFNLDEIIKENTLVTLVSSEDVIVSFIAKENFRTLIISSKNLEDGTYSLYQNGTNDGELVNDIYINNDYKKGDIITITNNTEFNVNSNITKIE